MNLEKLKVILQELIITNNIAKSELEKFIDSTYKKKEELAYKQTERNSNTNKSSECDFPF